MGKFVVCFVLSDGTEYTLGSEPVPTTLTRDFVENPWAKCPAKGEYLKISGHYHEVREVEYHLDGSDAVTVVLLLLSVRQQEEFLPALLEEGFVRGSFLPRGWMFAST